MKFGRSEMGQAIVEFALLLPALVLLLVGLMEFSLVRNSRNTVLFASRDGSMLAAEGGNIDGTDCLVLRRIESDIVSPSTTLRVQQVAIYWSDQNGDQIGSNQNIYTRSGSTSCDYPDGSTVTVPYTLTTAGYVESTRCRTLAVRSVAAPASPPTPRASTRTSSPPWSACSPGPVPVSLSRT